MFDEIADGVFAAPHRVVEGKAAIVFGERHALAIDACNDPEEGEAMVAFIRSRGYAPKHLLYTHGHADHALGSPSFAVAGAIAYAHPRCAAQMERTVERIVARDGVDGEQLASTLCWPAVLVPGEWSIDLGGRTVNAIPTPGHSDDSICAWLPSERLLVGGDTVVTAIPPSIADGDSGQLVASLEALIELAPEIVLPGHGAPIHGVKEARRALQAELDYVRLAGRLVARLGDDPDAVVDELMASTAERLPTDRYHMPRRHRALVDKIRDEHRSGAELSGGLAI